jgi:hypothetical protein
MTNNHQTKLNGAKHRRPKNSGNLPHKSRKTRGDDELTADERLELARRAEAKRQRGKPPSI